MGGPGRDDHARSVRRPQCQQPCNGRDRQISPRADPIRMVGPWMTIGSVGRCGRFDLRAGLRQVDVARRAGVSRSLVSAIEGGRCATVTMDALRRVDEKARLIGGAVGRERLGWVPRVVGRVLILPDTDRARRQVAAHAPVFDVALPARGSALREWLRDPVEPIAGILFVADIDPGGRNAVRPGAQRVRVGPGRQIRREDAPG
jgi:transcriptional regulator with XRE-family HTH domain